MALISISGLLWLITILQYPTLCYIDALPFEALSGIFILSTGFRQANSMPTYIVSCFRSGGASLSAQLLFGTR